MPVNIPGKGFCRYIIGIPAKGVFDFFCNQFKTGQDIKNKGGYRDGVKTKLENKSKRKGHYIEENEFLNKYTVGKRDGCILDPFAGSAYVREGL